MLTRGRHHPRPALPGEWWLPEPSHQCRRGFMYKDQVRRLCLLSCFWRCEQMVSEMTTNCVLVFLFFPGNCSFLLIRRKSPPLLLRRLRWTRCCSSLVSLLTQWEPRAESTCSTTGAELRKFKRCITYHTHAHFFTLFPCLGTDRCYSNYSDEF